MSEVYLINGLTLILLAVVVHLQSREEGCFRCKNCLWFLEIFAVTRGIRDLCEFYLPAHLANTPLIWANNALLVIAYLTLMRFAQCLIKTSMEDVRIPRFPVAVIISPLLLLAACIFTVLFSMASAEPLKAFEVDCRYFLGLPAGILTAWGFYCSQRKNTPLHALGLANLSRICAAAFLGYAFLEAFLVHSQAESWDYFSINNNFGGVLAMPALASKGMLAAIMTFCIGKMLAAFNQNTLNNLMTANADMEIELANQAKILFEENACQHTDGEILPTSVVLSEKDKNTLNQNDSGAELNSFSASSLLNDSERTTDELLTRCDIAINQANTTDRNAIRRHDRQVELENRASLERDVRLSLQQNDFLLFYQVQTDSEKQSIGTEALVRWLHPQRGFLSPSEFIPLLEETEQMIALDRWVLTSACTQLALWSSNDVTSHLTLAVNISSRYFHHPEFVNHMLDLLKQTGTPPGKLKLELTESLLFENVDGVIAKMNLLKSEGVCFALDDFGTGYSSLSYLKRLPLDQLKIDQSFVRNVLGDPNNAGIAKSIVALGQSLGFDVIAEGVETEAQREFLAGYGCFAYQGYHFGRPMPVEDFEKLLRFIHEVAW